MLLDANGPLPHDKVGGQMLSWSYIGSIVLESYMIMSYAILFDVDGELLEFSKTLKWFS